MNGKQAAILWLGLLLIALRSWTEGLFESIWTTVAHPAAVAKTPTASSTHSSSETGQTGSVVNT